MSSIPSPKFFFIRLLIPLVCGILLQNFFKISSLWQGCFIAALSFFLFERFIRSFEKRYHYRWLFGVAVSIFFVGVGALSFQLQMNRLSVKLSDDPVHYRFFLIEKSITASNKQRLLIELLDYRTKAYLYPGRKSSLVDSLYPDSLYSGTLALSTINNSPTNHRFDYKFYCLNKGITHSGYMVGNTIQPLRNENKWNRLSSSTHWRSQFKSFISSTTLSDSVQSVIYGITLGDTKTMDNELLSTFRHLGIAHLLAVSGLHVGILYGLLVLLFGMFFRVGRFSQLKVLGPVLLIWIFCWLVGFSPSVLRATVMCSFFGAFSLSGRPYLGIHVLAVTAFLLLLFNPLNLFDVGFQLSFTAVLFIMLAVDLFNRFVRIENRVIRNILLYITVCVAAQIGVLPLTLYYFSYFQPWFLLPNLLIVPLVPFFMLFVIMLMLLGVLGIEIAFPLFLLDMWFTYFFGMMEISRSFFIDHIISIEIGKTEVFLSYLLLLFLFYISFRFIPSHYKDRK